MGWEFENGGTIDKHSKTMAFFSRSTLALRFVT